ncbi:uncharacterized protein TNCV_1498611 [Trichonephila clavipes]|nr:uncharacterized protein TNCV_1498611 [Trichonephila clavipes]
MFSTLGTLRTNLFEVGGVFADRIFVLQGCRLVQDFLIPALDSCKYGDLLKWDSTPNVFQIRWTHKSRTTWSARDSAVFLKKVIESVEEGERKVDVAKAFEIPLSSLSTILKNKANIFNASSSTVRKSVSTGNFPRLEQCLVSWMRQCGGQNISMGGSLLKEKAKAFAKELGI